MRPRRQQPRDVRGRYTRRPASPPPWWFIVLVVGLVFVAAYLI